MKIHYIVLTNMAGADQQLKRRVVKTRAAKNIITKRHTDRGKGQSYEWSKYVLRVDDENMNILALFNGFSRLK